MSESDKYEVLEQIGRGSFGVIRKVRRKTDGMILCRKEISYLKMSQKEREQLHAEFQILSTLRHPNIVGYYHREHLKQSQDLHLYMEYCGNGDLGRVIKDLAHKNHYAEESFVWSVFSQLVTALYRCHYGIDPPEVGKTVLGLGTTAKPKAPTGGVTILHRDLKPENVFLSEDNSVKLGDFGLSKMIQSHDFASTYVGTPFYMSPEICAAEKYTLKSDIWSLGCIVYELCTREPPFNAKSHFQLIQKIKEGRFAPLPAVYSAELMAVIKDCLRVNPDRRPDTAELLNLPVVRLMRKEKEVVEYSKLLKTKEESLARRARDLDQKTQAARQELDASLRREWEVKARLEIDRLVKLEIEQLRRKFEEEVQSRVQVELAQHAQKKAVAFQMVQQAATITTGRKNAGEDKDMDEDKEEAEDRQRRRRRRQEEEEGERVGGGGEQRRHDDEQEQDFFSSSGVTRSDYPHSSVGALSADGDFPSTTDITELSIDSPETSPSRHNHNHHPHNNNNNNNNNNNQIHHQLLKKSARTPFARAQTMFAGPAAGGTPMDIEMASPSPMTIASLSLSPRRNAGTKVPPAHPANIFAAAQQQQQQQQQQQGWEATSSAGGGGGPLLGSDWESDAGWNGYDDEDDDDDDAPMPSPTRMIRSSKNPFTSKQRPALTTTVTTNQNPQKAAPVQLPIHVLRSKQQAALQQRTVHAVASSGALRDRSPATRRLSKIPSAANLLLNGGGGGGGGYSSGSDGGGPTLSRHPSSATTTTRKENCGISSGSAGSTEPSSQAPQQLQGPPTLNKLAGTTTATTTANGTKNTVGGGAGGGGAAVVVSNIKGRTLVELQQARAGGRPLSGEHNINNLNMMNININNASPKRAFREHAAAGNRGGLMAAATVVPGMSATAMLSSVPPEPVAVWDPEKDEMPSPFLVRRKPVRNL